jgi:hypothetical protein
MVPLAAVADVLGTSLDHVQVRKLEEEREKKGDREEKKEREVKCFLVDVFSFFLNLSTSFKKTLPLQRSSPTCSTPSPTRATPTSSRAHQRQ